jgi:hypothetical protein
MGADSSTHSTARIVNVIGRDRVIGRERSRLMTEMPPSPRNGQPADGLSVNCQSRGESVAGPARLRAPRYTALGWPASRGSHVIHRELRLARPAGLEPATLGLEGEIRVTEVPRTQSVARGAMPRCHAAVSRPRIHQASHFHYATSLPKCSATTCARR